LSDGLLNGMGDAERYVFHAEPVGDFSVFG